MTPYYEQDGITIYHDDCRELLPTLQDGCVGLVLTDPPYGRGKADRFGCRDKACRATPYTFIRGDDKPFDPQPLLCFPRLVLWGANWFADRLPASNGWLIWDKKDGGTSDDFGDAELAWTNVCNAPRLFSHKWRGMIKASERDEKRLHPTQKPAALMSWVLGLFTAPGDVILDPFMGSGTTLVAALQLGRRAIGIEIEERYCEIAARRLAQGVLPLTAPEPAPRAEQIAMEVG